MEGSSIYGKIFASMFKGSLYGQWEAIVTFTMMIVLADQHGEVDMTAESLSAQTSIPLDIIRKGIAQLEAPDPKSRTPDEDGRRIVRVSDDRDWGWTITNYAHYRAIRSLEERREYMRQYQRERRQKLKPVNNVNPASTPVNNVTHAVSSKQEAITTRGDVGVVLSRYQELHPRRKVTAQMAKIVERGLKDFSAPELIEAIEGNAADPWHREKRKHELSYILRNSDKINEFRDRAHDAEPRLIGVGGEPTTEELAAIGIRLA